MKDSLSIINAITHMHKTVITSMGKATNSECEGINYLELKSFV